MRIATSRGPWTCRPSLRKRVGRGGSRTGCAVRGLAGRRVALRSERLAIASSSRENDESYPVVTTLADERD